MEDEKAFERSGKVEDMAFRIVKPREIGYNSLDTVGKTCRIIKTSANTTF